MDSDAFPSARQPRFHELLNNIHDTAVVFFNAQLNELFGNTDEALLDFAENSQSNAVQNRFFEAMGFVRKYRTELEQRFREEIRIGFERFGRPLAVDSELQDEEREMSLVGQEEMEEAVAVNNLIMRAHDDNHRALHDLGQRLAVLNHGRKLEIEDIPCAPTHLVHSYRNAMGSLSVDIKAKLVLYALFDKFMVRHLKELYGEFNGTLKDAGILPNLKPVITKADFRQPPHIEARNPSRRVDSDSQPSPGTDAEQDDYAAADLPLGEELFGSILKLMSHRRHPSGGHPLEDAGGSRSSDAKGGGRGSGGGPARSHAVRQQLMSAIDDLQPSAVGQGHGVLSDLEALPRIAVDPGFLDTLKSGLEQEREQIFAQVDRDQMAGIDADTIDLIGMLFEYMLNDPLLPNVAKALLSHLHTPYLKLSLEDRQLLVDSEHPARLLLDMLVEAGGQWVYENDIKRGIFPHMQTVVDRVLQDTGKEGLFEEMLDYFKASMEEQRRRSDAIEHRSQESAKGREKLQVAKQRAAREMKTRAAQVPLPKPARRFLTQAWSDRLVFILLRHEDGEHSDDWRQALSIADDLVWLFGKDAEDAAEEELSDVGARVREAVDSALDTLGGYHQHYLEELFRFLDDPDVIADWKDEQGPGPYSEPLIVSDSETLLSDSSTPRPGLPGPPPQAAPRQTPANTDEAALENPEDRLDDTEREMLERLQNLKFGTWFEFSDKGDAVRRLKLSWLSPLTSTCMFVDRSGVQAEVKSLVQVAKMLAGGKTKIIPRPRHQFVERAMLAIKNTLQRSMEATD